MDTVKVNEVVFNEGQTKLCLSLVGTTKEELFIELETLKKLEYDVIEWRLDCLSQLSDIDLINEILVVINESIHDAPLILTLRTIEEGGLFEQGEEAYFELLAKVLLLNKISIIDIEALKTPKFVKQLIDIAKTNNVKVLLSSHDFKKTLGQETIINRLCDMQALGADITKIAVMPNDEQDVLTLINAAMVMKNNYATKPFIAISMGQLGMVSRFMGNIIGSCLTFAAINNASAPGQINAKDMNCIMRVFNK